MGRREEKLKYIDQSLRAAAVAHQHYCSNSKRGSLHSHGGIFVDSSWCSLRGIWSGNISRLCDDGEYESEYESEGEYESESEGEY